jgi:hypothetical protein
MTQKEFKTFTLIGSFTANTLEEAKEIISQKVYYGSKLDFTMFELNRGTMYFHFVNYKGEIDTNIVLANKENSNRYQLRRK